MMTMYQDKYDHRKAFTDEELDEIGRSTNWVILVEGCLCVLMLSPGKLSRVVQRVADYHKQDLLQLLLKRVVLGYTHYKGAVTALLELGTEVDYGGLVSDLRIWASTKGSLDMHQEFGPSSARTFLRAAILYKHTEYIRVLAEQLDDLVEEKKLASKVGVLIE
jgi:hypothetical protein